jgi:hypothetical protein
MLLKRCTLKEFQSVSLTFLDGLKRLLIYPISTSLCETFNPGRVFLMILICPGKDGENDLKYKTV